MENILTLEQKIGLLYKDIYTAKISKAKQEAAFLKIIENLPDDAFQRVQEEISALYLNFLPKTSVKVTKENIFNKILPILAKRDDIFLQQIYSNGERLCATNGEFIVVENNKNIDEGFYGKDMIKLSMKGAYPNIDIILEKTKNKKEAKEKKLYRKKDNPKKLYLSVDGVFFNYDLFQLVNLEGTSWYLSDDVNGYIFLYGECGNFQLVIAELKEKAKNLIEIAFPKGGEL